MALCNFFRINLPYGIYRNEHDEWFAFNREYMPLGYNSTKHKRGFDSYSTLPLFTKYKGLGEMNADQLWETTMNPATRTLKQVTLESIAEADLIFSMLMGDEVAPRREFIESHAKYARLDV